MEEVNKDVTQTPSPAVSDNANQNPQSSSAEGQTQTEVATEVTPAQGQEQPNVAQVEEVNWKNRAMEYQRKLNETVESLPKIIEESVRNLKPAEPKQPEYTVADLKAFVDSTDDVANKRWAYSEIERLEQERLARTVRELTQKEREAEREVAIRQKTEEAVINDPRFSNAFTTAPDGRKVFNFESPMTQLASQYMKDPALASRPDGLAYAMKLAYAELATQQTGQVAKKLDSVKVENTKLKQSTLIEGGGVGNVSSNPNPVADAMNDLSKTGSKKALRTLTQTILKNQGLI